MPLVRQAAEEADYRGIDLGRALLLGPVTAAGEHLYVAQCWNEVPEVGQQLVHAGESDHHVAIAGNVKRRNRHLQICERRQQLPVAVDVAIIVESAAEAAALELAGVEIDIGFAQPRGQCLWHPTASQKTA